MCKLTCRESRVEIRGVRDWWIQEETGVNYLKSMSSYDLHKEHTRIIIYLCKGSIILLSVGVSDRAAIPPVDKTRVITVNNFTSVTIKFQISILFIIILYSSSFEAVCSLTWVFSCLRGVIGWCNWCGWGGSTAMGTEDAANWRHPTESCKVKWDHEHLQSFDMAGMMAMVFGILPPVSAAAGAGTGTGAGVAGIGAWIGAGAAALTDGLWLDLLHSDWVSLRLGVGLGLRMEVVSLTDGGPVDWKT